MSKSAPREDRSEGAAFTPDMMREYTAGLADSTRIQAQAEAEAMAIRAAGEAEARRLRASGDADVNRTMRGAHASTPTSSFSLHGRRFRLSFKGTTIAFVAAAVVAVGGVVLYQSLTPTGTTGNSGDTSTGKGGGAVSSTAPTASTRPSSPPTPEVREQRKVVMSIGSNADLDFPGNLPDISLTSSPDDDKYVLKGYSGSEIASVDGEATAESCQATTDYGFVISTKNIRKGLTACVLTNENRLAAIDVLGWQQDEYGLSSITLDVTTWEKSETAS